MKRVPATEARDELSQIISRAEHAKERIAITRHGRAVAVVVPIEDLALLEHAEDLLDNEQADAALDAVENRNARVLLDDLKRELGR